MAASVRELLDESVEATSRGDVTEIARLYHPNAALQMPGADPIVGREAIAGHFRAVLAEQPDDLVHEVTEEHIHRVTPDLAIVDTVGTSRSRDRRGVEGFTMIAVRDGGEWLWAGMRGTLVRSQGPLPVRCLSRNGPQRVTAPDTVQQSVLERPLGSQRNG